MQHATDLLSIAAAARQIGVNRSTLSRQVNAKQVRSHAGKVRLSEAVEDRENNLDWARTRAGKGGSIGVASGVAATPTDEFRAGTLWAVTELVRRVAGACTVAAIEAGASPEVGRAMEPLARCVAVEVGRDVLIAAGLFGPDDDPDIWPLPETFDHINWDNFV